MRKFIFILVGLSLLLTTLRPASAQSQTLWYNGNLFGQDSLRNHIGGGTEARVFDDFVVTSPGGWQITSAWSNQWFFSSFFGAPPTVRQAEWSIRTGMSEGSGGTILASGISSASVTSTGRIPNFLYQEYTIRVSDLNVFLAPGAYWLNVTPLFAGDTYLSVTRGGNAVGVPAGNTSWPGNRTSRWGSPVRSCRSRPPVFWPFRRSCRCSERCFAAGATLPSPPPVP